MKHMILTTLLLGGLYLDAPAQEQANDSTLNRTVVVENQYNPEVMDAFKINVLPKVEEPAVSKQEIDYATLECPFTTWQFTPMASMTSEEHQHVAQRGYARAAYGNRNNADAKFAYLWDMSQRDRLQFMASLYGMHGKIASLIPEADDWKSRFFRTDIALDYGHRFQKVKLSLGGSYTSQVFNYMPGAEDATSSTPVSDRQHYTIGEGHFQIASIEGKLPMEFALQAGLRSFKQKYDIPYLPACTENELQLQGFVAASLQEEQQVGVGMGLENTTYNQTLEDNTLLKLNPYYTLENQQMQLRIGVHVDWQFSNGSGIKVSPDIRFDYLFAEACRIYLHLTGGVVQNDLYRLNELSPYGVQERQMKSSHTPLDAQIGIKSSPLSGFGVHLFGGYRITKDDLFVLPSLAAEGFPYIYSSFAQEKSKVGYGGAGLSYGYKDRFDISLSGTYYHWDLQEEAQALLCLKPEFVLNASARFQVYDNLWIQAKYNYEGRMDMGNGEKADAVNNLSLAADYALFNSLNVFVQMNNVLNKEYISTNGYPVQGLNAMAGVSIRF